MNGPVDTSISVKAPDGNTISLPVRITQNYIDQKEDYKYIDFIECAKEWYDHEYDVKDTELLFIVPCKSYADNREVEFTKDDLDKVRIYVTLDSDPATEYDPSSVKENEGDYYYRYSIPSQKWGAKYTIHFEYGGREIDSVKYAVKGLTYRFSIKVSNLTYNGKVRTPALTVKYGSTVLKKGTDYLAEEWDSKTIKDVGFYTLIIYAPRESKYGLFEYGNFKVLPKGTSIGKLTKGKKSFKVTWKKQATQTTGYQIQYGLKKNFKGAKITTIKKNKTTKATIKKLKKKKTYYVRVRTYKTVAGKKIYSAWSKTKKIKTK